MYLKLSFRNAKRSVNNYLLYITTMIILLAIMEAADCMAIAGSRQDGFQTAALPFLIAVILVVLVGYINSFMLKQRSVELAGYSLLGMDKSRLSCLLLGEFFIIGAGCFIIGVLLGMILYAMLCSAFLKDSCPGGAFWGQSILQTFLHFLFVELLSALWLRHSMGRLEIRELMTEKTCSQSPGDMRQYRKWGLLLVYSFTILAVFLCMILFLPEEKSVLPIALIAIPLLLSIFAFYQWLFRFLYMKRMNQADSLYLNNRLYLISQLTSMSKTAALMNGVFCVCLLFSVMSFLFGALMLQPDIPVFNKERWQYMGLLQISLCMVFIVIYFTTLSLQQIIALKNEAKNFRILYWSGKTSGELKALLRVQTAARLAMPVVMCLILLVPGLPLINRRLLSVFLPYLLFYRIWH